MRIQIQFRFTDFQTKNDAIVLIVSILKIPYETLGQILNKK